MMLKQSTDQWMMLKRLCSRKVEVRR